MYLVDFKMFNTFIANKGLEHNLIGLHNVPAIVEYKKDGVLIAKVEVLDAAHFKFQVKNAAIIANKPLVKNKKCTFLNRFWIRGNEWKVIDNQQVMKLEI